MVVVVYDNSRGIVASRYCCCMHCNHWLQIRNTPHTGAQFALLLGISPFPFQCVYNKKKREFEYKKHM